MKLAAIAVVASLGLGGAAYADRAGVPDVPPPPAAPQAAVAPHPRGELRELVLERFDRNHDGVLQPDERRHAIHALRTLARRMANQERRREARVRDRVSRVDGAREPAGPDGLPPDLGRMLRRLDTNHDGQLSPEEMPPGLARRLRRFDRNGDGVLSPDELPPQATGRQPHGNGANL